MTMLRRLSLKNLLVTTINSVIWRVINRYFYLYLLKNWLWKFEIFENKCQSLRRRRHHTTRQLLSSMNKNDKIINYITIKYVIVRLLFSFIKVWIIITIIIIIIGTARASVATDIRHVDHTASNTRPALLRAIPCRQQTLEHSVHSARAHQPRWKSVRGQWLSIGFSL